MYIYKFRNNERRAELYGRECKILAKGKMNSVLIEMENGERVITSANALREKKEGEGVQGNLF